MHDVTMTLCAPKLNYVFADFQTLLLADSIILSCKVTSRQQTIAKIILLLN